MRKSIYFLMLSIGILSFFIGCSSNEEKITMEEYEQLSIGMTLEEVRQIVGGNGEFVTDSKASGMSVDEQVYEFEGESGGSVVISISEGKVAGIYPVNF
jgi:hypothetical protein